MTRLLAAVALASLALSRSTAAEGPPRDWLTPGQVEPVMKRLFESEPFLASRRRGRNPAR